MKISEVVKEDQKLLSFMRQTAASGPKAAEYLIHNSDLFKEVDT